MSSDVITVDENTPILQVGRILEENNIRHLPVTREGKLAGMITDQEVIKASPSRFTTLKAHELYHLLAETRARDIMVADPVTIRPDQTVEVAAVMMLEHRLTGIPVTTEQGEILGIITQGDVFKVLISITGIYQPGIQFAFNLEDRPGSIKEVADVIRDEGGQVVSILSTSDTADEGYRNVFIRIKIMPESKLKSMIRKLEKKFMILYMVKDPLKGIR
jgi:acetoin utilization protein AcuB